MVQVIVVNTRPVPEKPEKRPSYEKSSAVISQKAFSYKSPEKERS